MVNLDPSRFELVEDNSNVEPLDPSKFELIDDKPQAQPKPVETSEKIDEDELDNNQEWLKNALLIYQAEEGEDWKGSKKGLSDWFKDRHSKLNWDITNAGLTGSKMGSLPDEQQRAWRESMAQYGNTKDDTGQFFRGLYHTVTDPFTLATLVPSALAIGFTGGAATPAVVAGQVGVRATAQAGLKFLSKTLYKNNLKEQLIKRKISESVADKIIKGEVVKGVKKSVVKKARSDASKATAKRAATLAAMEGGTAGAGGEQPKPTDAVKMKDARKVEKFEAKPLDTEKPLKK